MPTSCPRVIPSARRVGYSVDSGEHLAAQGLTDQQQPSQRAQGGERREGGRLQSNRPPDAQDAGVPFLGELRGADKDLVAKALLHRRGECRQVGRAPAKVDRDGNAVVGQVGSVAAPEGRSEEQLAGLIGIDLVPPLSHR
jgi:hypothetical protein